MYQYLKLEVPPAGLTYTHIILFSFRKTIYFSDYHMVGKAVKNYLSASSLYSKLTTTDSKTHMEGGKS